MADTKFNKESMEWKMFADYWILCQKYWDIVGTDEYWENLVKDIEIFAKKYKELTIARRLAGSLVNDLEERSKKK